MDTAVVMLGEVLLSTDLSPTWRQDGCFYPTSCHSSSNHYHHLISNRTTSTVPQQQQHDNPAPIDIFAIQSFVLEGDELDSNHKAWRAAAMSMDEESSSSSSSCSSESGNDGCFGGEALIEEALGVRAPSLSSASVIRRGHNRVKFSQVRVQEHALVVADEESFDFHVYLDWAHAEEKNYSIEDYEVQKRIKKSYAGAHPRRLTCAQRRHRLYQVHGGRRCDLLLDKLDGDSCFNGDDHRQWRRDVLTEKAVQVVDGGSTSSFMDKQRARFIAASRATTTFAAGLGNSGRLQDHNMIPAVSPYFRVAVAAASSNDLKNARPWHEISFASL